jgi:sulfide dehydrogenase cytochrome subunit
MNKSKPARFHTLSRCNTLLICLVTATTLVGSMPCAAQEKISTCTECHGSEGLGFKAGIPHLNGQPASLLTNMLNAYREGKRPTKVKFHKDVPAADVPVLAKHYSEQKAQRPKSATKPELVARGEKIYTDRCADCHVDAGRDSDKDAPLMAAQDLEYLIAQTLAFKSGERKFPYLMDAAYKDLSDEDLTAVAHFFASQDQVAPAQAKKRRR